MVKCKCDVKIMAVSYNNLVSILYKPKICNKCGELINIAIPESLKRLAKNTNTFLP